jgi:Ulp1 family protease
VHCCAQSPGEEVLVHLAMWLVHEAENKLGNEAAQAVGYSDAESWPRRCETGPRQDNDKDCGVFTILYAECAAFGR